MLLFWFSLLLFGVALAGIILAVCLLLLRRWQTGKFAFRSPWFLAPLGCGVGPFLAIVLLFATLSAYQSFRPASWDFEEAFGVAPGPEIKNLKGKTQAGFDSRYIYLAFDYSDQAWSRIIQQTGNRSSSPLSDLVDSDVYGGGTPSWWNPAAPWVRKPGCKNRLSHSMKDVGYWRDMVFIHCVSDGRIYVLASRID
jgi:hypothetical protein